MNVRVDIQRAPKNGHADEVIASLSIRPTSAARISAIFRAPHLQPRRQRNDLQLAGWPCNVPLQHRLAGIRHVSI
jgi:hypothetical protein